MTTSDHHPERRPRILLMEGDPHLRFLITVLFEPEHEVLPARSAQEAVALMGCYPSALIADLDPGELTRRSAVELARDFRARFPSEPILLISEHPLSLEEERIRIEGDLGHFALKPLRAWELLNLTHPGSPSRCEAPCPVPCEGTT